MSDSFHQAATYLGLGFGGGLIHATRFEARTGKLVRQAKIAVPKSVSRTSFSTRRDSDRSTHRTVK